MKTPTFKKGQWLISRWKKSEGGETHLCRFCSDENNYFFCSKLIIFSENEIKRVDEDGLKKNKLDRRKSLQWRPATKAELNKYSQLIFS